MKALWFAPISPGAAPRMRSCAWCGVTWCKRAGGSSNHRPALIPCRLSRGFCACLRRAGPGYPAWLSRMCSPSQRLAAQWCCGALVSRGAPEISAPFLPFGLPVALGSISLVGDGFNPRPALWSLRPAIAVSMAGVIEGGGPVATLAILIGRQSLSVRRTVPEPCLLGLATAGSLAVFQVGSPVALRVRVAGGCLSRKLSTPPPLSITPSC